MCCHASFSGQHAKELLTSRQIVSGSPTISPAQNETGSWREEKGRRGGGGRGGKEGKGNGKGGGVKGVRGDTIVNSVVCKTAGRVN